MVFNIQHQQQKGASIYETEDFWASQARTVEETVLALSIGHF